MANKKVLLSTDIGADIDDALSLLIMLNHPKIDLKGIYTTYGKVDERAFIARHMINLSKEKVKVALGESNPMSGNKPSYHFEDFLVDDSFIDDNKTNLSLEIVYKSLKKNNICKEGIKDMSDKLSKYPYTLFSIGPLTNIAKLIEQEPEAIKKVEHLYAMAFNFKNTHLEYNSKLDPKAAQIVLDSDLPLTIIPKNLCDKFQLSVKELDSLKSSAGKYVKKMADSFIAKETAREFRNGEINRKLPKEVLQNLDFKKEDIDLIEDLYFAVSEPKKYFEKYNKIISDLKKSGKFKNIQKKIIRKLESFIPKSISVHDVFVPYCFLYPNKISIEKKTVKCDPLGNSYLTKGKKHNIVVDIDFNHFESFLKKYLR